MMRLNTNAGQGLLEVVIVALVFGTAVATAVPVYLGFRGRQADQSARASLLAAVPMTQAYRQDHGSFLKMDAVDLLRIDPRVSASLTVVWAKRGSYCLTDTVHGRTWSLRGSPRGEPRLAANGSCA
jgi:type II secretory pathway pseudopilin PulG